MNKRKKLRNSRHIKKRGFVRKIRKKKSLNRCFRRRYLKIARMRDDYWKNLKKRFIKKYFKKRFKKNRATTLVLKKEIGLESNIGQFLDISKEILKQSSCVIKFDLHLVEKIWPSGVMLFASLVNWIKITTKNTKNVQVMISSTRSDKEEVNAYLDQCGFYDYVNRSKDIYNRNKAGKECIVRIKHENTVESSENRQEEVMDLINNNSSLSNKDKEILNDRVLTEIFGNVIEHGFSVFQRNQSIQGWYLLSQLHEDAGFISVCIADNGIGIENSLLTGPQRENLINEYKRDSSERSFFLKRALEANISGAFNAPVKEGSNLYKIYKRYKFPRGERRGFGLKRVVSNCKKISVPITIISGYACISFDKDGDVIFEKSYDSLLFAGTMYYLQIPTFINKDKVA